MKILKRLLIGLVSLVVLLFVVLAVFISTLDLNAYKEDIQELTKDQTGRDLLISGELSAKFFPWIGISIGELQLSNAEGFGDRPFARIDNANVSIEVLPLLRQQINVDSVELSGLMLDLQRAADGSTNWDDLMQASATTSTTTDDETTEVEGGAPAIAALAVGGISFSNANISWLDKQGGLDAQLSNFSLKTGAIELASPFPLQAEFDLVSHSMAMNGRFEAEGDVTVDLENQRYLLSELNINTSASGEGVPVNNAALNLGANITADLTQQTVEIAALTLDAMGIKLQGMVNIAGLDTDPQITASLATEEAFSIRELFETMEIEAPVTADDNVLKAVSLNLDVNASTSKADLENLTIKLDDTTFSGRMSVPNLAGDLPPVRFSFNVDDIDVDRYLPPPVEGEATEESETNTETSGSEDIPIELPQELIRKLDIEGEFSVDKIKVSNLTAQSIVIPLTAKKGVVQLKNIAAQLYEGKIDSSVTLNASKETPSYAVNAALDGILAEPLLADLLQDEAPMSGQGMFAMDITTKGNSVNALKAALNGGYNMSFTDGAINGVNIGYQLRRARAALKGNKLSEDEITKKTDFSALTMSGKFTDGVLYSEDLDLRAPVLRLGGKGTVDLTKDYVDYTLDTLLTDTAKGQGGKDSSDLSGVKLSVPLRGHFDELSADFTGVILQAMKDDVKIKLKAAEDEAKAKAKAKLKAEEERLKADLKVKEEEQKAKLKERQQEEVEKLKEKAREKLKGLFN